MLRFKRGDYKTVSYREYQGFYQRNNQQLSNSNRANSYWKLPPTIVKSKLTNRIFHKYPKKDTPITNPDLAKGNPKRLLINKEGFRFTSHNNNGRTFYISSLEGFPLVLGLIPNKNWRGFEKSSCLIVFYQCSW